MASIVKFWRAISDWFGIDWSTPLTDRDGGDARRAALSADRRFQERVAEIKADYERRGVLNAFCNTCGAHLPALNPDLCCPKEAP